MQATNPTTSPKPLSISLRVAWSDLEPLHGLASQAGLPFAEVARRALRLGTPALATALRSLASAAPAAGSGAP